MTCKRFLVSETHYVQILTVTPAAFNASMDFYNLYVCLGIKIGMSDVRNTSLIKNMLRYVSIFFLFYFCREGYLHGRYLLYYNMNIIVTLYSGFILSIFKGPL